MANLFFDSLGNAMHPIIKGSYDFNYPKPIYLITDANPISS